MFKPVDTSKLSKSYLDDILREQPRMPTRLGLSGMLSPGGVFYACDAHAHCALANELIGGDQFSAEKEGWVVMGSKGFGFPHNTYLYIPEQISPAQRKFIENNYAKLDENQQMEFNEWKALEVSDEGE